MMNSLPKISVPEFSDLITQIYNCGSEGDFNQYCLPSLAEVFSSDSAAIVRLSDTVEHDRIIASIGFDQFQLRTMMINTRSYGCSIFSMDQNIPSKVLDRSTAQSQGPCDDHPHGKYWLVGVAAITPSYQSLVWFSRDADQGEYSAEERELLELLLPHLQKATELSDDVTDLNMHVDAVDQILNRTPFGIFFLDIDGTVLFQNGFAKRLLKTKDCFSMRGNRLFILKEEPREKFEDFLNGLRNCADPLKIGRYKLSVKSATGENQYNAILIPMRIKKNSGLRHGDKIVLLQVHNLEPNKMNQPDGLDTFYQLTAAETKVCQRLYASKSLSEAAADLGISINTAKTHLIRSFRKIGVSSQAELLQRLAVHPKNDW